MDGDFILFFYAIYVGNVIYKIYTFINIVLNL